MLKVAKNHEKRGEIGPNGVFGRLLDVFGVFMTKKCTKTNIFAESFAKNQGGPPILCPLLKSLSPLNRPMERRQPKREIT
jgi:hypothetical protein